MPPPPPPKKGTAPTTTFEALDVTGRTADRQRLEAANASFNRGEYDKAALAAWELMNDPKMAPLQLESQYLLGKTLYRMGQYHAALGEFSQILAKGKDTKFFSKSLEWLFFISHKTVNESVVLDEVARYANADWPERYQDEFHYLLARYHFVRGRALDTVEQKGEAAKSFEDARKLTALIPKSDRFYAQAKYLEGLTWFRDGKMPQALEAMKEVVRVTWPTGERPPAEAKVADATRDLASCSWRASTTARGRTGTRSTITGRSSAEAAVAGGAVRVRLGQLPHRTVRAGAGQPHHPLQPVLPRRVLPRGADLKAVIYYENQRYAESTAIVQSSSGGTSRSTTRWKA
jgi:tetratricopeptide (TPR) repeat protein